MPIGCTKPGSQSGFPQNISDCMTKKIEKSALKSRRKIRVVAAARHYQDNLTQGRRLRKNDV